MEFNGFAKQPKQMDRILNIPGKFKMKNIDLLSSKIIMDIFLITMQFKLIHRLLICNSESLCLRLIQRLLLLCRWLRLEVSLLLCRRLWLNESLKMCSMIVQRKISNICPSCYCIMYVILELSKIMLLLPMGCTVSVLGEDADQPLE